MDLQSEVAKIKKNILHKNLDITKIHPPIELIKITNECFFNFQFQSNFSNFGKTYAASWDQNYTHNS